VNVRSTAFSSVHARRARTGQRIVPTEVVHRLRPSPGSLVVVAEAVVLRGKDYEKREE
jgi:hypothetical protein